MDFDIELCTDRFHNSRFVVVAFSQEARDSVDDILSEELPWRWEGRPDLQLWEVDLAPLSATSATMNGLAAACMKRGMRVGEITRSCTNVEPYKLAPDGTAFVKRYC